MGQIVMSGPLFSLEKVKCGRSSMNPRKVSCCFRVLEHVLKSRIVFYVSSERTFSYPLVLRSLGTFVSRVRCLESPGKKIMVPQTTNRLSSKTTISDLRGTDMLYLKCLMTRSMANYL